MIRPVWGSNRHRRIDRGFSRRYGGGGAPDSVLFLFRIAAVLRRIEPDQNALTAPAAGFECVDSRTRGGTHV